MSAFVNTHVYFCAPRDHESGPPARYEIFGHLSHPWGGCSLRSFVQPAEQAFSCRAKRFIHRSVVKDQNAPSPIGCKRAVESTLYAPRRPRNVVFVQCLQCSKEFSPFLAFCKKSVSSTRSSASSGCGDVHRRRARRHSRDGSAPSPPRRGFPATSRAVGRSATAMPPASCSPRPRARPHCARGRSGCASWRQRRTERRNARQF